MYHIYIYIEREICVYISLSLHICMYIYIYMYVCMYVCVYINICVYTYIYIYTLHSDGRTLTSALPPRPPRGSWANGNNYNK